MTGALGIDRTTLRDAWTLTRMELRTYVRHVLGTTRQTLGVGFMLLAFGVGFPLFYILSAVRFGDALASGSVPLGTAGIAFLGVAGIAGYIGAAGGFNQPRVGHVGTLVQTSIPPRAVSIGRFANRTVQSLALVLPASLVLLTGVGYGASGPLAPLLVAVGAVPMYAAGLLVGRLVGDGARYVNDRFPISLWLKALVGLLGMAGLFLGTQVVMQARYEEASALGSVVDGAVVPGAPLQAYASVVFAPLGSTPSLLGVGVVGVVLAASPLAFLAAMGVETHMLVTDLGADTADRTDGTQGVPRVFDATPATRVAWRYLLRTRRDPRTLAHLTPLLFGLMGLGGTAVQDPGFVLTLAPAVAVIGGAILAGAAYSLNPLGDDRDQLPLLLTSTPSVAVMLRGRMLAGAVLGLVLAVGIGTPTALVTFDPAWVLGQTLLSVVLVGASTGTAVGLGAIVPKFEQREYMSIERAHPSQGAMLGFMMAGLLVGAVGFGLLFATLGDTALLWVGLGWSGYLTVLTLVSVGGYYFAVRRLDAFTLDDI